MTNAVPNRLLTDVIISARDAAPNLAETIAGLDSRLIRSVVVVDNGSRDSTGQIARDAGAVVLREPRGGYGRSCKRAISHLAALPVPPDVVVFMAADGSDDPAELPALLAPIRDDNAELVIGARCADGARVAGAPTRVVIGLIGAIYRHRFEDLGPYRAIRFPALIALGMADGGSGWNVEMQVKALKLGLHIVEIPVTMRRVARNQSAVTDRLERTGRVLFQILRHATVR